MLVMDSKEYFPLNIDPNLLWLLKIAAAVLGSAFLSILLRKFMRSKKGWEKTKRVAYLPLQIVIWEAGLFLVLDWIAIHLGFPQLEVYIRRVGQALFITILIWIALRWAGAGFDLLFRRPERFKVNIHTVQILRKLTSITLAILGLLLLFQILGINVIPLLTFGGIGMAALAFAAQDMVANFFGGITLHFVRPFEEGDFIELPSQNNFQGRVEEIGWYGTFLRDADRREVFFPNSVFVKGAVINLSKRTHTRILEKIPMRYRDLDNVMRFEESLRITIAKHPKIDATQNFSIALNGYTANAAELLLDLLSFERDKDVFLRLKEEILFLVRSQAIAHNIEILPMVYVQSDQERSKSH